MEETPLPVEECQDWEEMPMETDPSPGLVSSSPPKPRRGLLPNVDTRKLFDRWKSVLPRLVNPLLTYVTSTIGQKWITVKAVKSQCSSPMGCQTRNKDVLCLFVGRALCHCLIITHNPDRTWQISRSSTSSRATAKIYFKLSSPTAFFRPHLPNPASLFQLSS